jgi:predicted RNA polymerase sigma factor
MDFEKLHREESGRILSMLIRFLGDFDLAEETLPELARPGSLELLSL